MEKNKEEFIFIYRAPDDEIDDFVSCVDTYEGTIQGAKEALEDEEKWTKVTIYKLTKIKTITKKVMFEESDKE